MRPRPLQPVWPAVCAAVALWLAPAPAMAGCCADPDPTPALQRTCCSSTDCAPILASSCDAAAQPAVLAGTLSGSAFGMVIHPVAVSHPIRVTPVQRLRMAALLHAPPCGRARSLLSVPLRL